jgi:hypothetical protein
MPGIFIGIGGIGGGIVSTVRDSLDIKVSLANDTPSAREAADQFRFMLIDTWKDGVSEYYDASQLYDVPEGQDKFEVDGKISSWWRGEDPTFRDWWPHRLTGDMATGSPLLAGPYASGAGQLRVKGRLAYRIALTGLGRPVVHGVLENLRAINAVRGPATGVRTVPVYLVCSLGGGSGSGMVLTLAQHLRQELPEYCPIVGVFPLASVTEMGPGKFDTASIWANTDTALREIDYCQRMADSPDNKLAPFFQWPGKGNVITGSKRPFEYVYLFGRENKSGQSLPTFTDYSRLIAESLIAESFSNLLEDGLHNHILGPHSQFIMQLQEWPLIQDRPTTYASAAVAALVFPVDRVERHLARRFAIDVLARMADEDDSKVKSEVANFVQAHALSWTGQPSFSAEFEKQAVNLTTRKAENRPQFSSQVNMATGGPFAKAAAAAAVGMAQAIPAQLEDWVGKKLVPHYRLRSQEIVEAYRIYLRRQIEVWLTNAGPSALGMAYEALTELRSFLDGQWSDLNKRYEGNDDGMESMPKQIAATQARYDKAAVALGLQFGSGVNKVLDRDGLNPKKKFLAGPYKELLDRTAEQQRMLAARQTYRELTVETVRFQRALKDLKEDADRVRAKLERETERDLGDPGQSGVLDLAVLDDPVLLRHHFQDLMEDVRKQGVDSTATRVTAPARDVSDSLVLAAPFDPERLLDEQDLGQLGMTGVVYDAFQRRLDPLVGSSESVRTTYRTQLENAIVTDGVERVKDQVRAMSIWDALAAECQARDALGLHDAAVEQASREISARRRNAEDAGVPARNWEHLKLQAFIRRRLEQCQKRVRPFWNLNGQMTANNRHPYPFVVLATDEKAYRIAESKHDIKGALDQISQLMGAGTPRWMPGQDRIVLYSREGVAPLFYLDPRELKRMRDASAQKAKDKFLFIDARFEECLDSVIWEGETLEDALRYALAMGLEFGIVQIDDTPPVNGDRVRLHIGEDSASYSSISQLEQAILADSELAVTLKQAINDKFAARREEHRSPSQQRARQKVGDLLKGAVNDPHLYEDREALNRIDQATVKRMAYDQYDV